MTKSLLTNPELAQPTYHQLSAAEERLLRQAISEDPHQIQQLIEVFYKRLFQNAFLHLGDETKAQQATRKSFVDLTKRLVSNDFPQDTGSLSKWVYQLHRQHVQEFTPNQLPLAEEEQKSNEKTQKERLILKAFRQLDFVQQEMLILHAYEKHNLERMAEMLNLPLEQVKSMVEKSLQELPADHQNATDLKWLFDRQTSVQPDFKSELEAEIMRLIESITGKQRVNLEEYDKHDQFLYRLRWLVSWPGILFPIACFLSLLAFVHDW